MSKKAAAQETPAPASEESGKEVVTKEEKPTAVSTSVVNLEEDAGGGFEKADGTAYAIPFLTILQSGSPQCKKSDGAYIEGAEEGMFYNTVTAQIVDGKEGVTVIPCYYTRQFIEWQDRDEGGGFVAAHEPGSPIIGTTTRNEKNRDVLPNGNYLVDTRQHYCLVVNPNGTYYPVLIAMASTQLKKSRRWMTLMDGIKLPRKDGSLFTPAMFSHMYKLTTTPESNDQGSWMGWKIDAAGPVTDNGLYQAAKSFRDSVRSGEVKVAPPTQEASSATDNGEM